MAKFWKTSKDNVRRVGIGERAIALTDPDDVTDAACDVIVDILHALGECGAINSEEEVTRLLMRAQGHFEVERLGKE